VQHTFSIIKAIIVYNFSFLVLIRGRDGLPDLPGGHLEVGEGVEQGLIREVREETQLVVGNIHPINQWILPTRSGIRLAGMTFRCELLAGSVILSDEHKTYYWQDLSEIYNFRPEIWVQGFYLPNELPSAASCCVSDRYDIANLIEAGFGELEPKRLKEGENNGYGLYMF
jgi:8-oxo-dGTP pyrophosphatase MutT (NUDIX family)